MPLTPNTQQNSNFQAIYKKVILVTFDIIVKKIDGNDNLWLWGVTSVRFSTCSINRFVLSILFKIIKSEAHFPKCLVTSRRSRMMSHHWWQWLWWWWWLVEECRWWPIWVRRWPNTVLLPPTGGTSGLEAPLACKLISIRADEGGLDGDFDDPPNLVSWGNVCLADE